MRFHSTFVTFFSIEIFRFLIFGCTYTNSTINFSSFFQLGNIYSFVLDCVKQFQVVWQFEGSELRDWSMQDDERRCNKQAPHWNGTYSHFVSLKLGANAFERHIHSFIVELDSFVQKWNIFSISFASNLKCICRKILSKMLKHITKVCYLANDQHHSMVFVNAPDMSQINHLVWFFFLWIITFSLQFQRISAQNIATCNRLKVVFYSVNYCERWECWERRKKQEKWNTFWNSFQH